MKLVLIGSSTGGPSQLKFLLKDVDIKDACVVIAQHMSPVFIPSFVNKFQEEAKADVKILEHKEVLTNKIYVCQKNSALSGTLRLSASHSDEKTNFNPNIDLLFNSCVSLVRTNKLLGIVLTGMGDDGAKGLFELYKVGARCLVENEADSVVYGMPKRARDLNPKLKPMGLIELKKEIINFIES